MQKPHSEKKDTVRKEVEACLTQLESLKLLLGKKQFNKRVKKATKLLTNRLPKEAKDKKLKEKNSADILPMLASAPASHDEASIVNQ